MTRLLLGILTTWCLLISRPTRAQEICGTMENLEQEIAANPERAARLQQIEQFTQQWIAEHGHEDRAIVTIPVVFHVVWRPAAENISDAKINAQLAQLNADFARLNSDAGNTPAAFSGLAVDTEVRFCLAQRDPDGKPTSGIVRRQTTVASFGGTNRNNVKSTATGGSSAWPRDSYLNFWSCSLDGTLLGFAQFPFFGCGHLLALEGFYLFHGDLARA